MGVAAARPHPKCGRAWLHLEPPFEVSATRLEDKLLLHIQLRPKFFKPCEKSDTFYLFQAYELDWQQLVLLNAL